MHLRFNQIVAGLFGLASFTFTVLWAPLGAHFLVREPGAVGTLEPNDPCYYNQAGSPCYPHFQWNLQRLELPAAWVTTTGSPDVIVAVIDTGVDAGHPDLAGKLVPGWDFIRRTSDTSPRADEGPVAGYGTALAGVVAATTNNGLGVAGVSWNAQIQPLKAFRRNEFAAPVGLTVQVITETLEFARRNQAKIVLMPFVLPQLSTEHKQVIGAALAEAHTAGVLLIAPVGESIGSDSPWPAAAPNVIGVTATQLLPDGREAVLAGTTTGAAVTVAAPGAPIPTTYWDSELKSTFFSGVGTDFAAAHVAGLAALIWSVNPTLPPDQVRQIIIQSADQIGDVPYDDQGRNSTYGYGRINARRALDLTPHFLQVNPTFLTFEVRDGKVTPGSQTIVNALTSAATWYAESSVPWLQATEPVGNVPSTLNVSVDPAQILATCGSVSTQLTIRSRMAQTVGVRTVQVRVNLVPCATLTPSPTVPPTQTHTPTHTPTGPTPTSTHPFTPGPTLTPSRTPTNTPVPTLPPLVTPTPDRPPDQFIFVPLLRR